MKISVVFVFILFISGCAFTVHDVKVDYKYNKPVSANLKGKTIDMGKIADTRSVVNNRMIMNMKNLNGDTTSGGWQAEKAISEIVRDAIAQGLIMANANLGDSNNGYELTGELLSFDSKLIMGFWEGSYKGNITVRLQLTDKKSSEIVWRDTFVGSSEVKGSEGAVGLLKGTLDNLVTKIFADSYFQQKLASVK